MKNLLLCLLLSAFVLPSFSQTKRIAHLSHSGLGYYFLDEFDDNPGAYVRLPTMDEITPDTITKISDTSVVIINLVQDDHISYRDTVYNPAHIENGKVFYDSVKKNLGRNIVVNGFDSNNHNKNHGKTPGGSNDHGPSDPGDGMMFPASSSDRPNVTGIMLLSLTVSTTMALFAFLVFTNVRRKSNQFIPITMENVK